MNDLIGTARLGRVTLSNSAWYLDQLITFLAVGDDTDGRFALLRVHGIQGAEPPAQYHSGEDQTIYLLDGEMSVYAGSEELHACPGDTAAMPRGLEHSVRSPLSTDTGRGHVEGSPDVMPVVEASSSPCQGTAPSSYQWLANSVGTVP
jgi:quercetin dioxygenase-like cupin family protein